MWMMMLMMTMTTTAMMMMIIIMFLSCRISGRATCIFSRHHHQTSSGDNRRQRSQEVDGDESLSSCSLLSPYWLFSRCPFRTSLLANQPHEVEDTAVRMFNSTLVYTGLELSGEWLTDGLGGVPRDGFVDWVALLGSFVE